MPTSTQPIFTPDHYYHIYNRGIAKQVIFHETQDFQRFVDALAFYVEAKPKNKFSASEWEYIKNIRDEPVKEALVEVVSFCLMPNHFHILAKQVLEGGISDFMRRLLNSYTRYYNQKRQRIGTVFQGTFRAVHIENNEQLIHVSRYIHLNPFVAKLVDNPKTYQWSSYPLYFKQTENRLCSPDLILGLTGDSVVAHQQFVEDYADYARSLADLKKMLIDLA